MKKIFGLLTDFGFDFAVASVKGVLLKAFPDAQIVDIDHSIEKFNILNAAFVLDKVHKFLPENTIFLCVVDPGVGTNRDLLCVKVHSQYFVGPNNGIFHYLFQKDSVKIYKIQQQQFAPESVTFHGRDIFAPAAINIAQEDFSLLLPIENKELVQLNNLGNQIDSGVITYIDSFGNIKTNIIVQESTIAQDAIALSIHQKSYSIKFTRTFLDAQQDELLCYKGSNGTLEIAVNLGSARQRLNAQVGDALFLSEKGDVLCF